MVIRVCLAAFAVLSLTGADAPAKKSVTVQMVAVEATNEGRAEKYFEPGLESIRKAVAEIEYDTFKKVASDRTSAAYGQESKLSVTPKCTLYVTPQSKQPDGRIKVSVRIEMTEENTGEARNLLKSTSSVVPNDQFKIRMKMNKGELVLVLKLSE